jgi:asparagine synthase (glutamine-hydrolysing)
MKTVGNIEKGILRRALRGILPDNVRTRRKSAYPSSQNPTYEEGLRQWALQILNDPNAPILPFINADLLRRLSIGKAPLPGEAANFLYERIIQVNVWLQEYQVSVLL